MKTADKYYTIFALLLLSIVWGSSFILIKKGLEGFDPLQVGTIRIVFAFIVLSPFALKKINPLLIERWSLFLIFGLVANLIPAILFALAETGLSSSLTGVLNSLTPIFTMLIGIIFFSTTVNKKQFIGLMIGLSGSSLISFVSGTGGLGEFNFYVLFVVLATVLYGFAGNMVKKLFQDINSLTLTSLSFLLTGPIALIVLLLFTDFTTRLNQNPAAMSSLGYLFILGAVGTALALLFFYKLIQMTSAVFGSTITYLIPIVAVMWGIVDGETLFTLHFAGMGFIIAGVYIVNKFK